MSDDALEPETETETETTLTAEERRAVGRQLAKAWRGIDAMRTLLWTCAVFGGVWALMGAGWWSVGGGAFGLICAAGALQVRKQPALWATILAVVLVPLGLALLGLSLSVMSVKGIVGGLVAIVGSIVSVRTMRRAERLIAAHPDHAGARRLAGEPRRKRR